MELLLPLANTSIRCVQLTTDWRYPIISARTGAAACSRAALTGAGLQRVVEVSETERGPFIRLFLLATAASFRLAGA
jgi:hypothetical protein